MNEKKKLNIPWHLVLLDIVGAILVAFGFYQLVSQGSGTFYVITGLVLMVPLIFHIINLSRQSKD